MTYSYVLEGVVLTIPMAAIIFITLKWISGQKKLLLEINPKSKELGPPWLCRGGWNEGEVRGCQHGYKKTGIPVEPVNTYSNLAYLAVGWVVYRTIENEVAFIFCCAMAFLCFGSALYHGIKTRWSARWDHGGMYGVIGGLAFYMVSAGHTYETRIMLFGAILSAAFLAWFLDGHLMVRIGLLISLIFVGVMTRGNSEFGLYSLVFFALAMVVWFIDKKTGVLGRFGHGIWHLFTAVALAFMFVAIKFPE